jgi:hypothetical protein
LWFSKCEKRDSGSYSGIKEIKFGEMTDDRMDPCSPTENELRQTEKSEDEDSEHLLMKFNDVVVIPVKFL